MITVSHFIKLDHTYVNPLVSQLEKAACYHQKCSTKKLTRNVASHHLICWKSTKSSSDTTSHCQIQRTPLTPPHENNVNYTTTIFLSTITALSILLCIISTSVTRPATLHLLDPFVVLQKIQCPCKLMITADSKGENIEQFQRTSTKTDMPRNGALSRTQT